MNRLYNSQTFELVVLYGRRNTGKTALLGEFARGKSVIYYSALETGAPQNLDALSRRVKTFRNGHTDGDDAFTDFASVFVHLAELARMSRVALVIDDCHYLDSSFRGFTTLVRYMIETRFKSGRLMLVLATSSSSFMEEQIDGPENAFAGVGIERINLPPLDFFESRQMCESFTAEEQALLYGVTGGMPRYLSLIKPNLSARDNIILNFFNPSSFMFEEPLRLMRQEAREPTYYNAILQAIAAGYTKNADISAKVGIQTSACSAYLNKLRALGVVRRETPALEKAGKKTVYAIDDTMFRFWYGFVPENYSLIQSGQALEVWERVSGRLDDFMDTVFTRICRQWLVRENEAGRLASRFTDIGQWWRRDGVKPHKNEIDTLKRWMARESASKTLAIDVPGMGRWWSGSSGTGGDTEIDILVKTEEGLTIFCDCKWSGEPLEEDSLVRLRERSELFKGEGRLFLFSKAGFTDACKATAEEYGNATLVTFETIAGIS